MTALKCPYCPEVYASTLYLAPHVHRMHREVPPIQRAAAIATARTVEDVPVAGPAATSLVAEETIVVPLAEAMPDIPLTHVCCVCGQAPPYKLYENVNGQLFCAPCSNGDDPETISGTTATDLAPLTGFVKVGRDIVELRKRLDETDARVTALDAPAAASVRMDVLSEVLDTLVTNGEHTAYVIVSEMMRATS